MDKYIHRHRMNLRETQLDDETEDEHTMNEDDETTESSDQPLDDGDNTEMIVA